MSHHHNWGGKSGQARTNAAREVNVEGLVLTRIAEAEAIGGAAKGQQAIVRLYGADEALEELVDVLLDGHLLRCGEALHDKIEESFVRG
jgi:hypothetical protein